MKKPLKEMLKKIGGNHLLSEGPAYEYAKEVKNIEKLDGRVRNLRSLRHPSSNLPTPVRDYTRKRHRHKHYRKTHRPYHRYIERGFR